MHILRNILLCVVVHFRGFVSNSSAGFFEMLDEGFPVLDVQQSLELHFGSRSECFRTGQKLVEQFRGPFSSIAPAGPCQGIRVVEPRSRGDGAVPESVQAGCRHADTVLARGTMASR